MISCSCTFHNKIRVHAQVQAHALMDPAVCHVKLKKVFVLASGSFNNISLKYVIDLQIPHSAIQIYLHVQPSAAQTIIKSLQTQNNISRHPLVEKEVKAK
ncbi:Hypothetical_protein [Hexamita inflata]|uniref:Hypothetical_protein n=1 Tax=Hexamita inflata TaxID=28002 RepID=A0AA86UR77_9EUKA|nr:Hypothetical protein HINF_LOCUS49247 [Hexamita inflata]